MVVEILRGGKKWLLSNEGGAGDSRVFFCCEPLPLYNADALGFCASVLRTRRHSARAHSITLWR